MRRAVRQGAGANRRPLFLGNGNRLYRVACYFSLRLARTSMPDSSLVIVLNDATAASLAIALRYASTAAAMDVAVEMHAVSRSAALLREGALDAPLRDQVR